MVLKRVYLDSNVFIAFVKQEVGRHFRLLGSEAERFFSKCSGKCVLVLSDYFFKEVKKIAFYEKESVCEVLQELKVNFEIVVTTQEVNVLEKSFFKRGMHFPDSLHAALAEYYLCEEIVTFNIKDFESFVVKIKVSEPLDLA